MPTAEENELEAKADAILRSKVIFDPRVDHLVKKLCEQHGYGAVMDSASRQWIKKDPTGAFYIGGCLLNGKLAK